MALKLMMGMKTKTKERVCQTCGGKIIIEFFGDKILMDITERVPKKCCIEQEEALWENYQKELQS